MRLKEIGTALVVVALLDVVGFAQAKTTDDPARFTLAVTDDEGRFFAGTTEDQARFTCTVNFANISKVTGSLSDGMGLLAAVPLKLMFESRPECCRSWGSGTSGRCG